MNIFATQAAAEAWDSLRPGERARTLAASYFAPSGLNDKQYKKKGVDAIVSAAELSDFCSYWNQFVEQLLPSKSRRIQATLQSRLLLNLSGGILENAGIAMEYICGVPVIPGSAVKGAARRYAIALMQECPEEEKLDMLDTFICIFGCVEADFEKGSDLSLAFDSEILREMGELYGKRKGKVYFFQAVPNSPLKLCADVLTPHHNKFMKGDLQEPTDNEDPVPSFFPAVQGGKSTTYTFTLHAPQAPDVLDTAKEWLTKSLTLFGLGAKGAAGYGLFSIPDKSLEGFSAEQQEAIKFIENKKKLGDMFAKFAKDKDKKPLEHWALLRAVSLPESDPNCRLNDFREFLSKPATDKKEIRARSKSLEAMQQTAQSYNFNFPNIP